MLSACLKMTTSQKVPSQEPLSARPRSRATAVRSEWRAVRRRGAWRMWPHGALRAVGPDQQPILAADRSTEVLA
jgi:hypothetical protein